LKHIANGTLVTVSDFSMGVSLLRSAETHLNANVDDWKKRRVQLCNTELRIYRNLSTYSHLLL